MHQGVVSGMRGFTVVWAGQVVSLLGTSMTQFALTIWAWQETGQATALALVAFFSFGPAVLLSPLAGALVDRWNRKLVMMLSDLGAGVATIVTLALLASGRLELWHLFILGAWTGAFNAFQFPAYSAAISTMLPKTEYARASGMLSLADSASRIAAPILAGVLLGFSGIVSVLVIDVVTFTVAIGALLLVSIPQPEPSQEDEGGSSLFAASLYGFRYIWRRPSLLRLQLIFTGINFSATFGTIIIAPMILAKTGNNELLLGSVQSALGIGGVVGGVLLSVWGGPTRRIHGVLLGMAAMSLFGNTLMGLSPGFVGWLVAAFCLSFFIPILNGSNQAIWQAKVPPAQQGRVFATRRLIAQITAPVAMLVAGPIADFVLEPALAPGGALAGVFGPLVGTGPGSGMGLMLVIAGLAGVGIALAGYLSPVVREVEVRVPDYDAAVEEAAEPVPSS
ncbi:MAG: MFS transporter [Trueperaceae bacterium]|nr:MFS transporter [Trueperaceae bacterium]